MDTQRAVQATKVCRSFVVVHMFSGVVCFLKGKRQGMSLTD